MFVDALRHSSFAPALRWTRRQIRYYRLPAMGRRNASYDRRTIELIRRNPGNHVDVGASVGGILRHMVEAHPQGTHVAFEAIPQNVEQLRARFPTVTVHGVALSDATGESEFNVASRGGLSGLRRIDYPPGTTVRRITVPMRTMDDLVSHPVHFIKIDVEGAELHVVRGARRILRTHRPVVVFEHGAAARHYETRHEDMYDLFDELRYDLFLMNGWRRLSREAFCQASSGPHWYFVAQPSPR